MQKKHIILIISIVLGAIGGYAYYYFYSCDHGCPLTSQWHVTTAYGALIGLTFGFPTKKKKKKEAQSPINDDKN
jgi:uncharacterized protein DUF6132